MNLSFCLFLLIRPMTGKGSVPTPMITFLNELTNRSNLQAIVGFGNRSFGENFAIGSEVISLKCKVPILHKVELFGNQDDVETVQYRIKQYE
jgi:protein involved in ribonucleotide reduction